jgi:predicted N-acetyltransferase YhbS
MDHSLSALSGPPAGAATLAIGEAPRAALIVRPGRPEDAEACGRICFEAFAEIARAHGFAPDFPTPDAAIALIHANLSHPAIYSVVAEQSGRIVGSNFLDLRDAVAGVGPISVDPAAQNGAIGRRLMDAVHDEADRAGVRGVRLVQSAYHARSLSLYAKLGYAVREPLVCMHGPVPDLTLPGFAVRPAGSDDIEACNRLAARILGHPRGGELADAVARGTARIVERDGRVTGYTSGIGFLGHAVGETNADLAALIGAAPSIAGPGLLVPMRNEPLFRWCLARGLRVTQPMTLMTRGPYSEPEGVFLPSILW